MSHKYSKSFKACVLIDVPRLERFVAETKLPLEKFTVTVVCLDAIQRQYSSLEPLARFENRKSEAIQALSLDIGSYLDGPRFHIRFRSSYLTDSIDCEVQSEDEAVLTICRDAVESFIDRNSPWWAVLGRIDYAGWRSFVCLGVIWITLMLYLQKTALIGLFTLFPMVVGFLLAAIVPRVFPRATFLIGAGDARFQRAEIWRVIVLVGFLISFAASIVVTEIYR